MKTSPLDIIGIDPSFTATGFVLLRIDCGPQSGKLIRPRVRLVRHEVHTCPAGDVGYRLATLRDAADQFYSSAWTPSLRLVGIESYARGARFRREEAGMVGGIVRSVLWPPRVRPTPPDPTPRDRVEVVDVPPRDAKRVACPDWPGWSKAHWHAAGNTGKFKMSMPDKASVISGLLRRWGIKTLDDAVADACCVAIYAASRVVLKFNPEA